MSPLTSIHLERPASSSTQRHCSMALINAHGGHSHLCGKRESFHFTQTWTEARTSQGSGPERQVQDPGISLGAAKLA